MKPRRMKVCHPYLLLLLLLPSATLSKEVRPNIIFIYADDMGYGDCGAYNPGISIPTPNIDRLAKEGLRFTDAHAPHATCTGSRYGFLTGTSPSRTGVRNTLANSRAVIDEQETTIAQLLKDQGYQTQMVGKWHLGFDLPAGKSRRRVDPDTILRAGRIDRGFEYFFGNIAGLSEVPIRGRKQVTEPVDIDTQNRVFCEDVVRILKEHAATDGSTPLFLYYALHEPHKPQIPEDEFVGKSSAGAYGDYLIQMDHWVGEVLEALRDTGLEKDTMVVFASDNGASKANAATCPDHSPNGGLSGYKAMSLEGGHRVPMIVKWPGEVPAGTTTAALVNHTDFFATFADLLGVDHAIRYPGSAGDSTSFLPVLSDPSAEHGRPPMVVVGSYRKGPWKLIADGHRGHGGSPSATALYDLSRDMSEKDNLVRSHQEMTKSLLAEYHQFLRARDLKDGAVPIKMKTLPRQRNEILPPTSRASGDQFDQ
ncbi:MAG: sulfatase-like hydrolase/transferase [Verrucomicrobiaceae bacterium]|nr:sulfatase-like hydrolase/transferase [Verrucomicrobiaceae bacterium]